MLLNRADSHLSAGRVKGWRLGLSPGFHPLPHRTVHEVFLTRLSDHLRLGVFKTSIVSTFFFSNLPYQVKPIHVCLLALKYSLRWSSRDLSCGGIGLTACTVTYFLAELG